MTFANSSGSPSQKFSSPTQNSPNCSPSGPDPTRPGEFFFDWESQWENRIEFLSHSVRKLVCFIEYSRFLTWIRDERTRTRIFQKIIEHERTRTRKNPKLSNSYEHEHGFFVKYWTWTNTNGFSSLFGVKSDKC